LVKNKSLNILLLTFAFLLTLSNCKTPKKPQTPQITVMDSFQNYPYWIAMMDSPGVNYFKAVEAFDKYWEHREKPTEDDGEGKDIFSNESKEEKENMKSIEYVYEYKRFLNWQQRNKNLVKSDGTIMTPEEVLEQWKKMNNDTPNR